MVFTCCVPNCKTGYRSNKSDSEVVSLFQFPSDPALRQAWINAIPRQNWTVSKTTEVCARHFHENDFILNSTDGHAKRKEERNTIKLKRSRLKPSALSSTSNFSRLTFIFI